MDSIKAKNASFLGRGWGFPPTFLKGKTDNIVMVAADLDIKQSLEILLGTRLGERVMLPEYGSDLNEFMFESMNNTKLNFLKELIKTAIITFEARIELHNISLDISSNLDGILNIHLDYTVITTNTRFNLVFPFYKIEGTHIPHRYHNQLVKSKKRNDE